MFALTTAPRAVNRELLLDVMGMEVSECEAADRPSSLAIPLVCLLVGLVSQLVRPAALRDDSKADAHFVDDDADCWPAATAPHAAAGKPLATELPKATREQHSSSTSRPLLNGAAAGTEDALLEAQALLARAPDVPALGLFGERAEWTLSCEVDRGAARVYRRHVRDGSRDFTLRCVLRLDAGVAELLSLVVELDLMPSWNQFCGAAAIYHRVSRADYYAGGCTRLPWPLPKFGILLRSWLLDLIDPIGCMLVVARPPAAAEDGRAVAALAPRPFGAEAPAYGGEIDAATRAPRLLPIRAATCALTPLPHDVGHPDFPPNFPRPRTAFDLVVVISLGAVHVLPGWVLDFFMRVCVPWLCRRVLALVHTTVTQPGGEFAERMAADATGVYAHIRRATKQPPAASHSDLGR